MKILFFTHQYFPRHLGGTEVYLRSIVRRAMAANHECRIITCHEAPSTSQDDFHIERIVDEGVPIIEIHFNLSATISPAKAEYDNPFVAKVVSKELEQFHPELVHVMHGMKLSGSALRACRLAKVPIIVTLCDYWFLCPRHTLVKWNEVLCEGPTFPWSCLHCVRDLHQFGVFSKQIGKFIGEIKSIGLRNRILRQELLSAKRILALSSFQKEIFVRNGYPEERLEVVSHGLEVEEMGLESPLGDLPDSPSGIIQIGFIGTLVPFKGAHILLEAIRRDPTLEVKCFVYGSLLKGPYGERICHLAKEDQRIQLMGTFPPENFGQVLRCFDILAAPALWYENNPLVVQGALYAGVPILASQIGSLTDMVKPGINGWLVKAGDVGAWTEAIRTICQQGVLRFMPGSGKTMETNMQELFSIYEKEARKCS